MEENTNYEVTETEEKETESDGSDLAGTILLGLAAVAGAGITIGVQKGIHWFKKKRAEKTVKEEEDPDAETITAEDGTEVVNDKKEK